MIIKFDGSADQRTLRESINNAIRQRLDSDSDAIYLDADLMLCIGTGAYAAEHPTRAVNCGVAEANMIGVACGLAAVGFHPVVHSFGTFASRRCYDQVFLSAGYAGNDITVLGSDPGICAALNGGTHMPFEDMALYRAIPGSTVIDITDTAMCDDVLRQCFDRKGVNYVRSGRKNPVRVYAPGQAFEIGKAVTLRQGEDITLIACGIMVAEALGAADLLQKEQISAAVVDMFTVKPVDRDAVIRWAETTGAIVTAENHNRVGGLHDAVTDALSDSCPVPVGCVAVEESFGEVGPQDYLRTRFQLTAENIADKARNTLKLKEKMASRGI